MPKVFLFAPTGNCLRLDSPLSDPETKIHKVQVIYCKVVQGKRVKEWGKTRQERGECQTKVQCQTVLEKAALP